MRLFCLGLVLASVGVSAHGLNLQPPAGFDMRLWNSMTRDQQIDLVAGFPEAQRAAIADDNEQAAMAAVKGTLKDPDSAMFRGIKRLGSRSYCGWVNAKNGFGGFAGYSVFFANSSWTIIAPPAASDPALGLC